MKGKKVDTEFLSYFISECIKKNKVITEDIIQEAKEEITNIDSKIKEVEKLKILRSKLIDVIHTFEKPAKSNKNEIKILSLFKIEGSPICKFICNELKNRAVKIDSIIHPEFTKSDLMFCIKQLLEQKIIARREDYILRGDSFDEYMKFVLKES